MQVQIRCRARISLRRLVPAFPMRITPSRGQHTLTVRGFSRPLREGQAVSIPAFASVDLHLAGSLFSPAECHLELVNTPPDAPHLRDLISGVVFHNPQQAWSASVMASTLHTTPGKIRSTLFTQGAAFTQICRTQRLMRALFESIQGNLSVTDLKARVGWADSRDLEASFYDWFGVSLQTVSRLREDCL